MVDRLGRHCLILDFGSWLMSPQRRGGISPRRPRGFLRRDVGDAVMQVPLHPRNRAEARDSAANTTNVARIFGRRHI